MEIEKIRKLYLEEGYNCAEATLLAMAEEKGMDLNREEIKMLGAFGGGLGCGEACGALCASIAIIGRLMIDEKAHETEGLKKRCSEYVENFRNKMGSINCRDLKPVNTVEGQRCLKTVLKNYELLCEAVDCFSK